MFDRFFELFVQSLTQNIAGFIVLSVIGTAVFLFFFVRSRWRRPRTVAVVALAGIIMHGKGPEQKLRGLVKTLEKLRRKEIKAIVLRVNSPGGTVAASQELFYVLRRIRESKLPVIALMEDVAASGGLYISLAANHIVAYPGTVTGSIGVIMQSLDASGALAWLKVNVNTVKSGKFKDIMSATRSMTEEEKALLTEMIMNIYDQFKGTVVRERLLDPRVVSTFADGRILSGEQAHRHGLVDSLGGLEDAIEVACRLAGIARNDAHIDYLGEGIVAKLTPNPMGGMSSLLPPAIAAELQGVPLWLMAPATLKSK